MGISQNEKEKFLISRVFASTRQVSDKWRTKSDMDGYLSGGASKHRIQNLSNFILRHPFFPEEIKGEEAMIFIPKALSRNTLKKDILEKDKKNCRRFGPCGVGDGVLYLNSFYFDRRYYVPVPSVQRVFKRIAMSRGGFTGKGMFASIPYLVVVYDDGREKQCQFKREEQVDEMLSYLKQQYPDLKGTIIHSDRGSQYTSKAFKEELRRNGMIQSLSGTGHCFDNARMESFFATLKKEKIYRIAAYKMKREQVKTIIFRYVFVYYNRIRVYTGNPMGLSPVKYREWAAIKAAA